MTIEWLAGNRLRGPTAERPEYGLPSGSVGGWKEISRDILGSAGLPAISTFDSKRYYMLLYHSTGASNTTSSRLRYNSTNGDYGYRVSNDGGSEGSGGSEVTDFLTWAKDDKPSFVVKYISNLAGKEKLHISHVSQSTGSTTVSRSETVGKWRDTSSNITSFDMTKSSGTLNAGTEVVVLGYDPSDTHTDNFWQQLYTDSKTGQSTDNIDTGTFTNKKYLWVQLWCKGTGNTTVKATFNNSTDSTYAYRASNDGGSEITASGTNFVLHNTKANDDKFVNMFIVNDGTNEILGIAHTAEGNSDGEGVAPQRRETAFQRSTATAITDIEFDNDDTGSFTDWEIKVWGHD